jgi:hypothetical protein
VSVSVRPPASLLLLFAVACDRGADPEDSTVPSDVQGSDVPAGSIQITEVMARPAGADDATGEWIELRNTTSADIDLRDWRIAATAGDSALDPLLLPAAGTAVIGASTSWLDNGGVPVDAA